MNDTDKTDETVSAPENAQDMNDGYWNEHELVCVSDYRSVNGGIDTVSFERCELENPEAHYFCAVNGETFALISRSGNGCLASVEHALSYACKGYRYTTFALKSRTPSALRAWRNKWSKRTANDARVSMFDASVRGSI